LDDVTPLQDLVAADDLKSRPEEWMLMAVSA
jgi:hypothetical protein